MPKFTFEYCLTYDNGQQYTAWIHANNQCIAHQAVKESYPNAWISEAVKCTPFAGMVQGVFCD